MNYSDKFERLYASSGMDVNNKMLRHVLWCTLTHEQNEWIKFKRSTRALTEFRDEWISRLAAAHGGSCMWLSKELHRRIREMPFYPDALKLQTARIESTIQILELAVCDPVLSRVELCDRAIGWLKNRTYFVKSKK